MGNNPSKSPAGASPTSGTQNLSAPVGDRRTDRRLSINTLTGVKAPAADPAPSTESATGQTVAHPQTPIQQRLQSRDIPDLGERSLDRSARRDATRAEARARDIPSQDPSSPVQVPSSARPAARRDPYQSVAPSGPPLTTYYGAAAHLQRPPRLPLPIADATATPGSPIGAPEDTQIESLSYDRSGGHAANDIPGLSSSTIDDDDVVDELEPYAISGVGKTVPTTIEWTGPGEKVYVTGTFVNWEKKHRLHRNEHGKMSTVLHLRPGTHHLKFIVDGEMRASDNLPTAVDFTNHLVNYIEVSADEVQRQRRRSDRVARTAVPPGIHPPQVLPEILGHERAGRTVGDESDEEPEEEIPVGDFRQIIPQALTDIDKDEDDPAYQRAANVIADAPAPPSLPLFLGRSILNGSTPVKDDNTDNSVLNNPNHTVLNHLATSSIKNGVLATSVTTRYKQKYVTTIMYKPTGEVTES